MPRAPALFRNRESFLQQIAPATPFYQLFDCLPEVAFFAKDHACRLICASRRFLERFGLDDESEVMGKDDFDLFPPRLADSFRRDDEQVLKTGLAKLNIVELFFNEQGVPDWYITQKLPLRNRRGQVIGLMGLSQSYESRSGVAYRDLQVDRAIEHIRRHFRTGLSVKEVAYAVHVSTRQLHRKFIDAFGMSPQVFIMKLRIQAACELLQTGQVQIVEAAEEFGFSSQSAFTELFHKYVGLTPLKFRESHKLKGRSSTI